MIFPVRNASGGAPSADNGGALTRSWINSCADPDCIFRPSFAGCGAALPVAASEWLARRKRPFSAVARTLPGSCSSSKRSGWCGRSRGPWRDSMRKKSCRRMRSIRMRRRSIPRFSPFPRRPRDRRVLPARKANVRTLVVRGTANARPRIVRGGKGAGLVSGAVVRRQVRSGRSESRESVTRPVASVPRKQPRLPRRPRLARTPRVVLRQGLWKGRPIVRGRSVGETATATAKAGRLAAGKRRRRMGRLRMDRHRLRRLPTISPQDLSSPMGLMHSRGPLLRTGF